jgi:CDP-diacylglycerol--serine O-phosphatidyltransferase
MGSAEKKTFTGMPIPAAAGILSSTVLFYDHMGWAGERSWYVLVLMVAASLLMVSTLRFHSQKEIDLKKRKPFWLLITIAAVIAVIVMNPEVTLFVMGFIYMWAHIVENAWLWVFRRAPSA